MMRVAVLRSLCCQSVHTPRRGVPSALTTTVTRCMSAGTDPWKQKSKYRGHHEGDRSGWEELSSGGWGAGLLACVSVGAVAYGYKLQSKQTACCTSKPQEPSENVTDKNTPNEQVDQLDDLAVVIELSRDLCQRIKDETGSAGLSISVMVDGKEMWSEGFGYADLENRVQCHPDSVMRIASISKSITMTIVAKLLEEKKLDLDKPIQEYMPEWPQKTFDGQKVDITLRQLVSHMSGIRHYDKNCGKKKDQKQESGSTKEQKEDKNPGKQKKTTAAADDEKEFYSKTHYPSAVAALGIFKNDSLCSKPGSQYLYTTHGWTVVSAVAEKVTNKKFSELLQQLFKDLGLENTYLDEHRPVIYNRARQYVKDHRGRLVNAPFVDNSNKWAGGGVTSTARDVAKFGNVMLYSSQYLPGSLPGHLPGYLPGYLQPSTMKEIWTPVEGAECAWDADGHYAMGWGVVTPGGRKYGYCKEIREYSSHTGAAVGGSSVLIILPRKAYKPGATTDIPKGVVVAMIANTNSVGLARTAVKIAKMFESLQCL